MTANLLEVNNLKTYFFTRAGVVKAVDNVSFTMKPGETLGVVGASGSGKSVSALSVIRLIADPPGKIIGLPVILMRNRPTYQIIMKKQMAAHKQSKMVSRLDKRVEHARHAWDDQRTINSLLPRSCVSFDHHQAHT